MQKRMKKLPILLAILFPLIITSCATKPKNEITLPPKPEREEIQPPENLSDVARILNYYEHLVQSWEVWGENVKELLDENGTTASK